MHVMQVTTHASAFEQALHIAHLESGLGTPLDEHAGRYQRLESTHLYPLCSHAREFATREHIQVTSQMLADVTSVIFRAMNEA